ncbi:hypothetical protein HMPREF9714_01558 [Myroides odoratimimus CCUG 12901]|uniref:DUF7638 domain-containing protein n=1 Tax=Myroides odoratimimus TaxID=76832 RepID=UPI00024610FD|nr:hypothetical protein [Myroides odoratimimus]EHO10594.1 hypothetical protein HMPREF9714_01558 [Myroides odoratimimus CCUG 12901]EPH12087.1 hypothetical protein HMPREF9713_01363 [Myroides odoratimimus CCUG 12700]MDM1059412.1 hypothetical protein [Myroides odoratimimus]MDM1459559.1 hypothetical protein [Myroides odoratimimus]MDM1504324.1 hypothetical protein [Myroides odoratimimus]
MSRTLVYRTATLQGVKTPGIIQNGGYHFTHFDVYEDGRIADWNFEDFEHFIKDVQKGWVVTNIPDGEEISCFNLGSWKIDKGQWYYTPETYLEFIKSLVLELNPNWTNIYTYQERKVNGVTVGESGTGTLYKIDTVNVDHFFPTKIKGENRSLFYVFEGKYYLVQLLLFKDKTILIHGCGEEKVLDFERLRTLIDEGIVCSTIPNGAKVIIESLGEFSVVEEFYSNDIEEIFVELEDDYRQLNGEKSLLQLCREALEAYQENPTDELKEALKIAYERIPEHMQMYLGDMDSKDGEYIDIIYGPEYWDQWNTDEVK